MITKVTATLFLGSAKDAANLRVANPHRISAIVNVSQSKNLDCAVECFHIPMIDGDVSVEQFERALNAIAQGPSMDRVLVHCQMGISRSALVVALFLVRSEGMTLDAAIRRLQKLRPAVDPTPGTYTCAKRYLADQNRNPRRGQMPDKRKSPKPKIAIPRATTPNVEPHVGIVFLVEDSVFIESVPVSTVVIHADCQDHEGSHIRYWEDLVAKRSVPVDSEYDEYPRGRVVYNTRTDRFTLMLDRCIVKRPKVVSEIVDRLHIPVGCFDTAEDSHYRCPQCMQNAR